MNRKLLLLLLALPVAVFATERLTTPESPDGGGKQKKTAVSTPVTNPVTSTVEPAPLTKEQPIQKTQQQDQSQDITPVAANTEAEANDDHVLAELKQTLGRLESGEDGPYNLSEGYSTTWMGDDIVGEKLTSWLGKNVSAPLKAANPVKLHLGESFSRCPSGYHIVLVTKDEKLTDQGWMIADHGCNDQPIGKFQYDMAAGTVGVFVGENTGYVTLAKYLKLYKAALS